MSGRLPSATALARAMTSLLPPGENGTTILSDLGSVTCAVATGVSAIVAKTHRAVREISVRMETRPREVVDTAIVSRARDPSRAARLCYDRSPLPGKAQGHEFASHHLSERPPRICAIAERELPARRRRATRLHRGRFGQRR